MSARDLNHWRAWGTIKAEAKGKIYTNNCRPDCASGDLEPHKGQVRLSKKRNCGNRKQYLHFVFDFRSPRRPSISSDVDCNGFEDF